MSLVKMLQSALQRISRAIKPLDGVDSTTMSKPLHHVDVPTKKATFAMACFWAPDALFGATLGVIKTRVGYCGGDFNRPTYRNLVDHTEAIQIEYDPQTVDYEQLLRLFWANHDPTAKTSLQYTSFIFYHDDEQKDLAEKSLSDTKQKYARPVVTLVRPCKTFWDAEDYHQKYRLQQHPYLRDSINISPNSNLLKDSYVAARLNGYVIGCGGLAQFDAELPILGLDEKAAEYARKLVAKNEGHGLIC